MGTYDHNTPASYDPVYRSYYNRERLILIVDPSPECCESLSVLFRLDGFQTHFSVDGAIKAFVESRRPDVVLINLQIAQAVEIIADVKAPGILVFATSDFQDVETALDAVRAGANDVFIKPLDTEKLVRRVVVDLAKDVHVRLSQSGGRDVVISGFKHLTPREREVLQLITDGHSNKEAGRQLGISPRTIEVHRSRVMEKLGARNTADLIRIVFTS